MTFRSLALSALKGNWRAYSAFFLSSVFAVFIFYVYGAFVYHPDVINGHFRSADNVRKAMAVCQVIVAVFSFFFVLYANAAFLKTRQKEFGLLTLYGMTRNQLRRMIMLENTVLAVLAIIVGTGIGILFSKLFFMIIALLLHAGRTLEFVVPLRAVLLTAIGYMALFQLLSIWSCARLKKLEIIDFLRSAQKARVLPGASLWLAMLALLSLFACYSMAWNLNGDNFILLVLPIMGLVTIGSYFLFTQGSIILLHFLQRRKRIYYKRTNLIIVSQLVYKLRDNATIFFVVALLSATVLTASGTFYVVSETGQKELLQNNPQTFSYYERGLDRHEVADPAVIESIFAEDGRQLRYMLETTGIKIDHLTAANAELSGKKASAEWMKRIEKYAAAISVSDYNRAAETAAIAAPLQLEAGQAVFINPYGGTYTSARELLTPLEMQIKGNRLTLQLVETRFSPVIQPLGPFSYVLVINDDQFEQLHQAVPLEEQFRMYSFEPVDWTAAQLTVERAKDAMSSNHSEHIYTDRIDSYRALQEMTVLTLFVGLFISLLCFIASGSMLYFKLFTEMKDDEEQFRALARMGMTSGEIGRIVGVQIGILFYVPILLGFVHTFFAMKSLSNFIGSSTLKYTAVVTFIYLLLQTLYFLITFAAYNKRMKQTIAPI
ncbi:ABC transporter permease [Paenibacillus sp. GCM10027626]|uniref:ABC transporter permease n=1 Tax=Paenibacillus sp. GCM10027626 TaxID=3273411 RepID=UPI00363B3E51